MSTADQPATPGRKPTSIGRDDSPGGDGNLGSGETITTSSYARKAGVVIRASVEHVGLVGDTELTVNVKWPASTFCVPPCKKPAPPCDQPPDSQNVPGNGPEAGNFGILYGEATADPGPLLKRNTSGASGNCGDSGTSETGTSEPSATSTTSETSKSTGNGQSTSPSALEARRDS
jgi:hypothetical protein